VNIRPAIASDIAAILALDRACVTAAHWSEDEYFRAIAPRGEGPERLVLVVESPDVGVAGFLVARHVSPEWELENVVVASSVRRNGIGKMLLAALIAAALERNSEAVFLEVRESNEAARRLYEKLGFRQTGRRPGYYVHPSDVNASEHAILYRIFLADRTFRER
jgi:ribosomal-protein-alanine acetyltransferase